MGACVSIRETDDEAASSTSKPKSPTANGVPPAGAAAPKVGPVAPLGIPNPLKNHPLKNFYPPLLGGQGATGGQDVNSNHPVHEKRKLSDHQALGMTIDFGFARDFHQHYTLGKELGHGQFGVTYNATNRHTGERVAAKTIQRKSVGASPAASSLLAQVLCMLAFSGSSL